MPAIHGVLVIIPLGFMKIEKIGKIIEKIEKTKKKKRPSSFWASCIAGIVKEKHIVEGLVEGLDLQLFGNGFGLES